MEEEEHWNLRSESWLLSCPELWAGEETAQFEGVGKKKKSKGRLVIDATDRPSSEAALLGEHHFQSRCPA